MKSDPSDPFSKGEAVFVGGDDPIHLGGGLHRKDVMSAPQACGQQIATAVTHGCGTAVDQNVTMAASRGVSQAENREFLAPSVH